MTDRELRRLYRERFGLAYEDEQPRRKESFSLRLAAAAMVVVVILAAALALVNFLSPLVVAPQPVIQSVPLPTAFTPPAQSVPQAPPASSEQQPAVAPQVEPTALPAAPTAIPVSAPPEPVTAPQQPEPTKGVFGGRRNDREAPPALMSKPRK